MRQGESARYTIIYRDTLLPGVGMEDLLEWVKGNLHLHRIWGAKEVTVHKLLFNESGTFQIHYQVDSLDRWNDGIQSEAGIQAVEEKLGKLIDLAKVEIQVLSNVSL